ncbi:MAG: ATP-dependent helicase HrpB [Halieaceae bacterium]|jgi:ATP-dependent helicase HrpB
MFDLQLPINDVLDEIRDHLAIHDTLIVEAPPGAGKTTIIPLSLLAQPWLNGRSIIMLQPRRLAAKSAATRMAALLGEDVGQTVGYRIRLDTKVSAKTRLEVVTEGVLLRMLREDPTLAEVGLLIFDEFHERSLDADLGLTLALSARDTFGAAVTPRILVMSATLAQGELTAFLQAPCIQSHGRMFPVTVNYGRPSQPRERIAERVISTINETAARHRESNILVFLPGQGEIRQVAAKLELPGDIIVHPLFGDLGISEQQQAIAPSPPGERKIVLATNIAETSLTIEGVDVVIDAGLERVPLFDPNTGMSRLQTVRISRASSEQRMGRAGRLRPGSCYRLWSETQQGLLNAHQAPEIENADLASLTLQLFAWGIYDPAELRWLTPPPAGAYQQSVDLLLRLGAVLRDATGFRLTAHGAAMAEIPAHPRLAHMLLAGHALGRADTASHLAAVLSDRDPVSRESSDMRTRLEYLSGEVACPTGFKGWLHRSRQLAKQFLRQLPAGRGAQLAGPDREQLSGYLIACAYPDRIARQRHSGGFQLANGRSCQFDSPSVLSRSKWLAVAEIGGAAGRKGDTIRSAAPLDPALFDTLLAVQLSEQTVVDWDTRSGHFVAERQRRCGALLLAREKLQQVSDEDRTQKLLELIADAAMSNLPWQGAAGEYRNRARLMGSIDAHWPSFEDEELLKELEAWLAPFLLPVKKLSELKNLDLLGALKCRLSWDQQQKLEKYLPERLQVPSGSNIRIDYAATPPVLAVKLQEMFGCQSNPSVAEGRLPLLVHLLSPAGRPLQVTQDLASFWRTGYLSVRKEMRGRYPKHPWPEDPLQAQPSAHTRHRRG